MDDEDLQHSEADSMLAATIYLANDVALKLH